MSSTSDGALQRALFDYALRMGDNGLVLSHRLAQWMGHAHCVEEDIALGNIGLDLLGQARNWLSLAGEVEGKGRDEDALAFLRDEGEFRNLSLVEQPNGDFARTIVRQLLHDARETALLALLAGSADGRFAAIAAKALRESDYHLRHSATWLVRLGDGTEESRERTEEAVDELWRFCDEMFWDDETDSLLARHGIVPRASALREPWGETVGQVFAEAGLAVPETASKPRGWGGQLGRHTEHLGRILAEMQRLPRQHPGARW